MLNQFILVFLTLIFYQQKISCEVNLGGGGVVNSRHSENDRVSRFQSQNQTLYIKNDWSEAYTEDALKKRQDDHVNKEDDFKVTHVEPFVNENHQTLNTVQKPSIVNIKTSLVNQDSNREHIAQKFTIADAKYSSNSPTKRLKLSAKLRKKNGTSSEADPNLNSATSSLKENVFRAHIEEINRINDKQVPDSLESASRDNSKTPAESEPSKKPDHIESPEESESVIVKTDFDLTTNKTILKAIHLPTYHNLTIFSGVTIQPNIEQVHDDDFDTFTNDIDNEDDISKLMARSFETFSRKHVVNVDLQKLYETITGVVKPSGRQTARFAFTKNSFLTGFSLGFLAFALKKLLLPFFIGIQIVKSILIAMFLPSILGSFGKIVGKGVTNFAQTSGSSSFGGGGGGGGGGGFQMMGGGGGGGAGGDTIQDFEFKDTSADTSGAESVGGQGVWSLPPNNMNALGDGTQMGNYMLDGGLTQNKMNVIQRYHSKYNAGEQSSKFGGSTGSFYYKEKPLQGDFKVFQKIPMSSHLLANYDPFYSPLLSRIDSVFKQLNYKTESCRERLICAMYNNPAKYAPYSNLVSAQLSRELNELRKPTTDNPEILRFFRYMKAAKDGQDGSQDCGVLYSDCSTGNRGGTMETSPPMVTTFNDINRLVQARNFEMQEDDDTRTVTENDDPQTRTFATQEDDDATRTMSNDGDEITRTGSDVYRSNGGVLRTVTENDDAQTRAFVMQGDEDVTRTTTNDEGDLKQTFSGEVRPDSEVSRRMTNQDNQEAAVKQVESQDSEITYPQIIGVTRPR